jgi:hypothetical protein
VLNRVGFVRKEAGKPVFYVYPESWRREILVGFDAKLITRAMLERGFLKRGSDGKPQIPESPPEGGKRPLYAVLPALFEDGDDPIPPAENPKNRVANS